MLNTIQCCYECKLRSVGCHATCWEYQRQRAARDEYLRERIAENDEKYMRYLQHRKAVKAEHDRRYREKRKREQEG